MREIASIPGSYVGVSIAQGDVDKNFYMALVSEDLKTLEIYSANDPTMIDSVLIFTTELEQDIRPIGQETYQPNNIHILVKGNYMYLSLAMADSKQRMYKYNITTDVWAEVLEINSDLFTYYHLEAYRDKFILTCPGAASKDVRIFNPVDDTVEVVTLAHFIVQVLTIGDIDYVLFQNYQVDTQIGVYPNKITDITGVTYHEITGMSGCQFTRAFKIGTKIFFTDTNETPSLTARFETITKQFVIASGNDLVIYSQHFNERVKMEFTLLASMIGSYIEYKTEKYITGVVNNRIGPDPYTAIENYPDTPASIDGFVISLDIARFNDYIICVTLNDNSGIPTISIRAKHLPVSTTVAQQTGGIFGNISSILPFLIAGVVIFFVMRKKNDIKTNNEDDYSSTDIDYDF